MIKRFFDWLSLELFAVAEELRKFRELRTKVRKQFYNPLE